MFDKKNPEVYFCAPVSGTIAAIEYGPQRRLDCIQITVGEDNPVSFSKVDVANATVSQAKSAILERGLWSGFMELPFQNIPNPQTAPPAILVSLSNNEPFRPKISAMMDTVEEDLILGLECLKALCPNVQCYADANEAVNLDRINEHAPVVRVSGNNPSLHPASVAYHLKETVEENKTWVCDWTWLVQLGESLRTNQYSGTQIISLGGKITDKNQHYVVTQGIALSQLCKVEQSTDRMVCGGLFTGVHLEKPKYLPLGVNAINVIDSDPPVEFVSFMQAGLNKPSFTRAYLGGLFNKVRSILPQADVRGSARDCISCGLCEQVCPVNLLPQLILRNTEVNDVEESMRLGVLDCTECGVCTYVCPSKIELSSKFSTMKAQLYKEANA